jgi:aminoglycoside phosphotransferase family enzyme/predicted kinase
MAKNSAALRFIADDQREAIAFLESPMAHGGTAVERIDTHISVVFLAGNRVYKLKRAVHYDYVDFSTLERRRVACEAEIRVNRRSSPALYLGTVPVVRSDDGALALGGEGEVVEWLVKMVRFDQAGLFDKLADRGDLTRELIRDVADAVARLHGEAEVCPDNGGSAGMKWVIDGNLADMESQGELFNSADVAGYRARVEAALVAQGPVLDARRHDGFVRRCHGDLHLRNVCLIDGRPALFDAIEFNDDIACCDVMYDIAFLIMDLLHRDLGDLANAVLNRYLAMAGGMGGLAPLALFLSCRAAVRAKTAARAATLQGDPAEARRLGNAAANYLAEATEFLAPAAPRLIAVGGLSGSGKSTLAESLAPGLGAPPGAVVLRSDVIRKRMFELDPTALLAPDAYSKDVTADVYRQMVESAAMALAAGFTVIADAVHARPEERAAIEAVAVQMDVPFTGLWLEAPAAVLLTRVRSRKNDASDADAAVLRGQLDYDLGAMDWQVVSAAREPQDVLFDVARESLGLPVRARESTV